MISRSNPGLDYIPAEKFGYSLIVSAGDLLFVSGVAPLRGRDDLKVVGAGDLKAQCSYILEILDQKLKAGGSSRERVVSWTVYLVDRDRPAEIGSKWREIFPLLQDWAGPHNMPAATAVGVASLFVPEQMIEIEAIATVGK